eukprot:CAMPEP_0198339668 /NCGR_PEP_ID=MMETSP1450-20131203/41438_1 /TAXON_ID=753684 ORGANISM="Madagascaria erythrocladiodes, Strain CCMP3234" /NCGR_SAMPLE_ID=MMETSP1450 /ASSEMBLY_ACC=CAM_ASM_001115 /LENGTH=51 /DNA_ID=CAMNT_0044044611 /DNA_START=40 /DNA_END=191 /DNA_ORIENTATION=+
MTVNIDVRSFAVLLVVLLLNGHVIDAEAHVRATLGLRNVAVDADAAAAAGA